MADERPAGPPATPAIGGVPLPPGYVLVEKLGSGGFATVWLAEQGQLGRRVAVKLLGESLEDSERERRFIAECRAIGQLSGHPAVVTVHDAGTTDAGHPYLVMEHLPGGSLHDRLHRQGPLPWPEVLDIGVHVADALAAAHEAGILHRDIKPANVLLDANGAPKLGDFGIARLAEGTNTATGVLVGTISFTPPEVLSGHRAEPTADVWALGATLHTLLTARSPFSGDRDEPPAATIARVLRSEAPPLGPEVPAPLRDLIAAMLRPDPGDRPADAAEVVARLQAIQAERGLPVTAARATRRAAPSAPIGITDATVATPTPAPTPTPTVVPTPPPAPADPLGDGPTVVGPSPPPASGTPAPPVADPATSVMAAHDPARVAPGGPPPPAAPPPPPPPPRPGSSERRSKAPILVGVAVLVALVLVAGVAVALLGGSGDGGSDEAGDDPGTETSTAGPDGTPDPAPAAAGTVDSPVGAPLAVPSGLASEPGSPPAWDVAASCTDGACSIVPADGDVVTIRTAADGTKAVETLAADTGEVRWTMPIEGVAGQPGLARRGDLVIVSSSAGGVRTYRGIADGQMRWSVDLAQDDGPVFPGPQVSDRYGVLELGRVGAYVVLDLETGEVRRGEGRVLATDRANVYVSDGGRIVARTLSTGTEAWRAAEDIVSAAPPDEFPAWRYGVVAGEVLVTVTAGEVVALNRESGAEVWDARVPTAADGEELGRPFAVSNVGDVVVVVAENGDLGVEAGTGALVWREVRDRLVYEPELDEAAIAAAEGSAVWVGTGDRLLVGWTGSHLQLLDVTTGEIVGRADLDPTGGRSALAIAGDAVAILGAGGSITAYGYESLDGPLWETTAFPEATGLAAVDGGLAVVDPTGVHGLRP